MTMLVTEHSRGINTTNSLESGEEEAVFEE